MLTRAEEAAQAADWAAQQRAPGGHNIGTPSPGFIRATHPDHGESVVYVPGELLPEWVVEALDAGRGTYDVKTGVMTLDEPAPARRARR